jgi:hypothetical protein
VSAGVLPRLARGAAGLGPCVVRELRPGERPAERLGEALEVRDAEPLVVSDRVAALLAHRAAGALLLVVVDQLEELFTLASAAERAAFLAALRALRAEPRCAVVFTLRGDFFGALMESDLRAERRGQLSRIEVSPLRGEALAESIAEPARRGPPTAHHCHALPLPVRAPSTANRPCNSFALLDTRLSWADHARHLPPQGCHAHSPQ